MRHTALDQSGKLKTGFWLEQPTGQLAVPSIPAFSSQTLGRRASLTKWKRVSNGGDFANVRTAEPPKIQPPAFLENCPANE
jgi:hypothetical protein